VEDAYQDLVSLATRRAALLGEAVQLLQFSRERGDIERWLTGREQLLASTDIGRSREEADALMKRHIEFITDLAANQARMQELEATAAQRIAAGHSQTVVFEEARVALLSRWAAMVTRATDRERELLSAQTMHTLLQDFAEAQEWVQRRLPLCDGAVEGEAAEEQLRRFRKLELEAAGYAERIEGLLIQAARFAEGQPKRPASRWYYVARRCMPCGWTLRTGWRGDGRC